MSTLGSRSRRLAALAAAGIVLTLGLAACSGGASQKPEEDPLASEESFEDWLAKYDSCLSAEGFPNDGTQSATISEADLPAYQAAVEKCTEKVGEAPAQGPEMDEDAIFESQLVFARCLRERGYDYPDPTKGGMSPAIDSSKMSREDIDECSAKAEEAGGSE